MASGPKEFFVYFGLGHEVFKENFYFPSGPLYKILIDRSLIVIIILAVLHSSMSVLNPKGSYTRVFTAIPGGGGLVATLYDGTGCTNFGVPFFEQKINLGNNFW